MHPMVTPEHVVTDRDHIMEHARGGQRRNYEHERSDDQLVVSFDELRECSHGEVSKWVLFGFGS